MDIFIMIVYRDSPLGYQTIFKFTGTISKSGSCKENLFAKKY